MENTPLGQTCGKDYLDFSCQLCGQSYFATLALSKNVQTLNDFALVVSFSAC